MSDMTQQEADRLLSYGSHLDECSVNNGLRGLVCDCGFGELRDEALVLFAPTATPQPAFHLKVVVAGVCITGDCDCMKYDQKILSPNDPPPFHDGCTCYLQPATDDAESESWQEQVMVSVACKTSDCDCIQYDGLILYTNQPPPFHDGCTCYTFKVQVVPPPATGNDAPEVGALSRVLEIARSITQLHLKVSSGSVLYETIELLIHAFKNYDAMMDDAPEVGTETGASQTVDGNLHPINDVSNTWDWGPEGWVEHYRNQIVSLRADLATVTAERDEKIAEAISYHADLKTERAVLKEETRLLLQARAELAAERGDADGLAERVRDFSPLWHAQLKHDMAFDECRWPSCINDRKLLTDHDTRRASEGGGK